MSLLTVKEFVIVCSIIMLSMFVNAVRANETSLVYIYQPLSTRVADMTWVSNTSPIKNSVITETTDTSACVSCHQLDNKM